MRIKLEEFTHHDIHTLINWIDSPETLFLWTGTTFKFPLTYECISNYFNESETGLQSNKLFKAVDESGIMQGYIELSRIDSENKQACISRVIVGNPKIRNKGICKQMIGNILKIGFEEYSLHRIYLFVFEENISAIECYKKSGFRIEGLLRDSRYYEGKYINVYLMSIIDEEYNNNKNLILKH